MSTFQDRFFTCDTTVARPNCGTNLAGEPMTCVAARQLGAEDFCTDSCNGDPATSSQDSICLDSNARLAACQPSNDSDPIGHPQGACGRPELRCLRTDLLKDEGVCMTAEVCAIDDDCHDPVRSVCASTLLRASYGAAAGLHTDHLYCLQIRCHETGTNCPPGESCLPDVIHAQSTPPDICVPNCDSNLNCPPNHVCYQKVSGSPSPAVCIPALFGFRCLSRNDCLVGDCVDTGEQFKTCTLPCQSDGDCAVLDTTRNVNVCASPTAGGPRYCTSSASFSGALCRQNTDCRGGEICTYFSPSHTVLDFGNCLLPCGEDGTCPLRGGLPHTCFDFLATPACYPGSFGIYCRSDGNCIGDLRCMMSSDVGATDQVTHMPICTAACNSDNDCHNVRQVPGGWCNEGTCVPARPGNRLCQRSIECGSGVCMPSTMPEDAGKNLSRCTIPLGGA